MGNKVSSASNEENGIIPSLKLKLKAGTTSDTPFEKYMNENPNDFKEFLYKNLDSDYVIGSILENSKDELILLEGISIFDVVDNSDLKKELIDEILNYNSLTSAGINVNISDTLNLCEKELSLRMTYRSNPFLKSFQRRFSAIRSVESYILKERSIARELRNDKEYSYNNLNSIIYPQLLVVEGLKEVSLGLLKAFPVCIPLLDSEHQQLLISPVKSLCNDIIKLKNQSLFSCWSPASKPPMKPVSVNKSTATSSSGVAVDALDDKPTSCWINIRTRSTWSVALTNVSDVSAINISWCMLRDNNGVDIAANQTAGFAPKKLTISVKIAKKSSNGKVRVSSCYYKVLQIDPVAEFHKQKTWNQIYALKVANVVSIQLTQSKYCSLNTSSSTKMYKFEPLCNDTEAKFIETLPLLLNIQTCLFPIIEFNYMESLVYNTLLSIIRSSCSLSLSLNFITYIYDMKLDERLKNNSIESLLELFQAIYNENSSIITLIETSYCTINQIQSNVIFDKKSSSSVNVMEQGLQLTYTPSLNPIEGDVINQYGLLSCLMDTGVWMWEITIDDEEYDDETTCIGVALRDIKNTDYTTSSDMWLVRCCNGEIYNNGRSDLSTTAAIHSNDKCCFTYDVEAQTVSLSINSVNHGVVFQEVPRGVSPIVYFYGDYEVKCRILSVKTRSESINSEEFNALDLMKLRDCIETKDSLINCTQSMTSLLLQKLSILARARSFEIERRVLKEKLTASSIEYPFCIEVSANIIQLLNQLLIKISVINSEQSNDMILSILQIINAQFVCLNYSNIDLAHIGFKNTKSNEDSNIIFTDSNSSLLIKSAMDTLISLRKSPNIDIRIATSTTFGQGLLLFLPNIFEKIKLTLSIITETIDNGIDTLDASSFILLEMLLRKLSNCEDILHIIELYKSNKESRFVIHNLISKLLTLVSEYTICKLDISQNDNNKTNIGEEFINISIKLLGRFQEQLIYEALIINDNKQLENDEIFNINKPLSILVSFYFQTVISSSIEIINASCINYKSTMKTSKLELLIRQSILTIILQPLLYSLCLFNKHLDIIKAILPHVVYLLEKLSILCKLSKSCCISEYLIYDDINRIDPTPSGNQDNCGWKTIKAVFEENNDSYIVSDNGNLYTSVHSNNTCALLNVSFDKNTKAAWEFLLEIDSITDECALFGCAHVPAPPAQLSRCYSSSHDLWMRRAYNGYMYAQGRTTGTTLEKIHPGDIIRTEFDGKAGTLSYSINGGDLEVGFTDINETIYPTCGSYRNGVVVRLLKVEVYRNFDNVEDISKRSSEIVHWNLDKESTRDLTILTLNKQLKDNDGNKWLTSRGDKGVSKGVHDFSFELLEKSRTPFAIGIIAGGDPYTKDILAGPCYEKIPKDIIKENSSLDASNQVITSRRRVHNGVMIHPRDRRLEESDNIVALNTYEEDANISTLRTLEASESAQSPLRLGGSEPISRSSIGPDPSEIVGFTLNSSSISNHTLISTLETSVITEIVNDNNNKEKNKADINIQKKNIIRKSNYSYDCITAMAWYSDGSLWYNGTKVADGFGKKFLPLEFMSAVTIRIDREEYTLSYYVNGVFVGTAFGPDDSDAVVKIPLPILSDIVVFPAGSVSCSLLSSTSVKDTPKSQSLRIKPTGFYGSTVIPLGLSLQKSCASIIGRMVSILLTGKKCDVNEELLIPWLQSPLLIGGIDNDENEMNKDEKETLLINSESSWDSCWSNIRNNSKDNINNNSNLGTNIPFSSDGRDSLEESTHLFQNIFLNKLKSTKMNDKNQIELSKEGKILLEWLENDVSKIAGVYENNMMKTIYHRIGNYSVPSCEMPSLACLLKHGGLINEAIEVIEKIETNQKPNYPSDDMIAMWKRIHQLRCLLRKMRQSYKELSVSENALLELKTINELKEENNDKTYNLVPSSASDIKIETELSLTPLSLQSTISYPLLPSSTSIVHSSPPIFENINDSLLELISSGDSTLFLNDEIAWKIQTPAAISSYTLEYECAVLAFGIDFENEIGYIRFHVYGNGSLGDLVLPTDSFLHVDDEDITGCDIHYAPREGIDPANDIIGCLRFDLSSCSNFDCISSLLIQFSYGHDYDPVTLQVPSISDIPSPRMSELSSSLIIDIGNNISVENENSSYDKYDNKDEKEGLEINKEINSPKSFDEFCSIIESKSLFLLSIVPSGCDINGVCGNNGGKSKALLLDLLERYTTSGTNNAGVNESKINRSNSYEGDTWGKVIDFLKVRSKLNSQVSNEKLEDKHRKSNTKKGGLLRRISEISVNEHINLRNLHPLSLISDRENEDFDDIGLNIDINISNSSSILQTNIVEEENEDVCKVTPFSFPVEISNLNHDITDDEIMELCQTIGKVLSCNNKKDKSGKSFGKSIVHFSKQSDATYCFEKFNGCFLDGSPMKIKILTPRDNNTNEKSVDNEDDNDKDDDNDIKENITTSQAAMQAISLFITSDNLDVSPKKLYDVMKLRTNRSEYRLFALECINEILNIDHITSDPMAIEEILLFVRPSLRSSNDNNVIDNNNNFPSRIHYLSNLEGCKIERLCLVQEKFLSVYSKLSILISSYIATWSTLSMSLCNIDINNPSIKQFPINEKDNLITTLNSCHSHILLSPLKLFLSLWSLNFSSRDYLFLIKSGVLQSLQQLTSFTNYEKAINVWYHNASLLSCINKKVDEKTRNKLNLSKKSWSIWPQSYVQNGLKTGKLSCRALLLHLYLAPLSVLSNEDRSLFGLNYDYDVLCIKYGISDVSYLYHQIFALIKYKKNKVEKDDLKKKELIELEISKKILEKSSLIADCGCFDKAHKADDVNLSDSDLIASIIEGAATFRSQSAICSFTTIIYDRSKDINITGNYFEIKIIALGIRDSEIIRDVGIGLADLETFETSDYMPGWIQRSYGYHGDDGRKFGINETPGIWPLFDVGDVIGCGIDMINNTIFYTRNGEFLGIGFTNITEPKLCPVVGFSNRHNVKQQVKINFGCEEFLYNGPEVILSCKIISYRKKIEDEKKLNQLEISSKSSIVELELLSTKDIKKMEDYYRINNDINDDININNCCISIIDDVILKVIEINQQNEESKHDLSQLQYYNDELILQENLNSANSYLQEFVSIKSYASTLLKFLLSSTCKSRTDEGKINNINFNSDMINPILTKELSLFGTPKSITSADGAILEENITTSIINEIVIGSKYLNKSKKNINKKIVIPIACAPPCISSNSNLFRSVSIPNINSSLNFSSSLNYTSNWETKRQPSSSSSCYDTEEFNLIEIVEVEAVLYDNLLLLNALLTCTKALQREISSIQPTSALFSLLYCGSPRIKQLVCNMLTNFLPGILPDDAETTVADEFKDILEQSEMISSSLLSPPMRRHRRLPDSVVKVLLIGICDALSINGTLFNDNSLTYSTLPFGFGNTSLATADHHISLIQKLFETPIWTELISCNITDALRCACQVVTIINDNDINNLNKNNYYILLRACAACSILTGLNTLRPGSKIQSNEGTTGWLVSINDINQTAKVVFSDNINDIVNGLNNMETVSLSNIKPVSEGVDIDLSRLSQPLLPHLTGLTKLLLVWFSRRISIDNQFKNQSDVEYTLLDSVLFRLNSILSSSLSILLNKQGDLIMDASHDSNVISDILSISLLPTGLENFPNLNKVLNTWNFIQSRILENSSEVSSLKYEEQKDGFDFFDDENKDILDVNSANINVTNIDYVDIKINDKSTTDLLIKKIEVNISLLNCFHEGCKCLAFYDDFENYNASKMMTGKLSSGKFCGIHSLVSNIHVGTYMTSLISIASPLEISLERSMEVQEILYILHKELNSEIICKEIIEESVKFAGGIEGGVDKKICLERLEYFQMNFEKTRENLYKSSIKLLKSNVIENDLNRNISTIITSKLNLSDLNPLKDVEEEIKYDKISDYLSSYNVNERFLSRINIHLEEENKETNHKVPIITKFNVGDILIESEEEGVSFISSGGRIGKCLTEGAANPDTGVIFSYYDYQLGVPLCEIIELNLIKKVESFYNHPPLSMNKFMCNLDIAITILRMRDITSKLLIDGNVNLSHDIDKIEDWLSMMKLITSKHENGNDNKDSNHDLHGLCSYLLEHAHNSSSNINIGSLINSPESTLLHNNEFDSNQSVVIIPVVNKVTLNTSISDLSLPPIVLEESLHPVLSPIANNSSYQIESKIIDILINDAEKGLNLLAYSSTNTESLVNSNQAIDESSIITCSSSHPYTAPFESICKFEVPSNWKGLKVTFDIKCRTACQSSTLKFYKSKNDYEKKNALFSFWGTHIDINNINSDDSSFQSFILTDCSILYYEFESLIGSDKPYLKTISDSNKLVIDHKGHISNKLKSSGDSAVGLGDDDTLFNLFDDDKKSELNQSNITITNALADCKGVSDGSWFFETTIVSIDLTNELRIDDNRIGILSSNDDESILLNSDITSYINNSITVTSSGNIQKYGELENNILLNDWIVGDIIGCLFDITYNKIRIWFSKNNKWTNCISLTINSLKSGRFYKPYLAIFGKTKLLPNYGETKFIFPPPNDLSDEIVDEINCISGEYSVGNSWKPMRCRPIHTAVSSDINCITNDAIINNQTSNNLTWGYSFSIQPLNDLCLKVTREFELIWNTKKDDQNSLYMWRPISPLASFVSCGDVITSSNRPPRGAVLVDKKQCKPPKLFVKIFTSSNLGISIWRPIPYPGYISLGDIVSTATHTPELDICACVPDWTVTECDIGNKVLTSKKEAKKKSIYSIWSISSEIGTFFGSSSEYYDIPEITVTGCDEKTLSNIGKAYKLKYNIHNVLSGEWFNELEVLLHPSVTWCCNLVDFLLKNKYARKKALTPRLFKCLVRYIRSSSSPEPLRMVPLLIQMIRLSQQMSVLLPFDIIDGLCKNIIQKAISVSTSNKNIVLSNCLVSLVDLVVEVQAYSTIKCEPINHNHSIISLLESSNGITKDSTFLYDDNTIDTKEKEINAKISDKVEIEEESVSSDLVIKNWFDRSSLNKNLVAKSKLLNSFQLDFLFVNNSTIRKIKQLLRFFAALGCKRFQMSNHLTNNSGNNSGESKLIKHDYPSILLSKIWYDHISNCYMAESNHPYSFNNMKKRKIIKKIVIPGAERLMISFDSRCSLGTGASLLLVGISTSIVVKGKSFVEDIKYANVSITGCELTITLEIDDEQIETNPDEDWGYSFIIKAIGPIYESMSTQFVIPDTLPMRKQISSPTLSRSSSKALSKSSSSLSRTNSIKSLSRSSSTSTSPTKKSSEQSMNLVSDSKKSESSDIATEVMISTTSPVSVPLIDTIDHPIFASSSISNITPLDSPVPTSNDTVLICPQTPLHPTRISPMKKSVCLDFVRGMCLNEDTCEFSHDEVDVLRWGENTDSIGSTVGISSITTTIRTSSISRTSGTSTSTSISIPNSTSPSISRSGGSTRPNPDLSPSDRFDSGDYEARPKTRRNWKSSLDNDDNIDETLIENSNVIKNDWNTAEIEVILTSEEILEKEKKEKNLIIMKEGTLISNGLFSIPHAQELTIMIERPNPKKNEGIDIIYLLELITCNENENDLKLIKNNKTVYLEIPGGDEIIKVVIPGSSARYTMTMIYKDDVEQIFNNANKLINIENFQDNKLTSSSNDSVEFNINKDFIDNNSTDNDENILPVSSTNSSEIEVNHIDDPWNIDSTWDCLLCTMINSTDTVVCMACMSPRSRPIIEDVGEGTEANGNLVGWWCVACTFINPLNDSVCVMCGTSRIDEIREESKLGETDILSENDSDNYSTENEDDHPKPEIDITVNKIISDGDETVEKSRIKKAAIDSSRDVVIISLKGKLLPKDIYESRIEGMLMIGAKWVPSYLQECMKNWTLEADLALIDHINNITETNSNIFSTPLSLKIPKKLIDYEGNSMSHLNMLDIQCRMLLFESVNKLLQDLLPIINLNNIDPYSIGSMIRTYSSYIFISNKQPLLEKAIEATSVSSGTGIPAHIMLDNFKAILSREKNEKDLLNSQCCFAQAYRQLHKKDSNIYRHIFSTDRVFQIQFSGESGIDAGGVFREGIHRIIEDLFSNHFNLLLLCSNGIHEHHINMDKYIPNPIQTGALALQMFEFVGKLMGMSIRAKLTLPFEFPSIIWKKIINEDTKLSDLSNYDALTSQHIEALINCHKDGIIDNETFKSKYKDKLRFIYCYESIEKELKKDGKNIIVTYDNRLEYCDILLKTRLSEFDLQISSIANGLNEVISLRILKLFSWQQLEILVTGNPTFDMDLWKSKTDSAGLPSKVVRLFWTVIESLSQKDKAGFVRFAWGRSRLPNAKEFVTRMKLTSADRSAKLPIAHTCFFSIELPEYDTEEKMRHGLLTAIHFGCAGILMG